MLLGITMGDAAGVGPEIVLKTFAQKGMPHPFVVIGDASVLRMCDRILGYGVELNVVGDISQCGNGAFNVLDMNLLKESDVQRGAVCRDSGSAALKYLHRAIHEAQARAIAAIVTLPMNKEATRLSVPDFTGHTEVIAQACGNAGHAMMLVSSKLLVTHVSTHVSLQDAIELTKTERILTVIRLTNQAARKLGRGTRIAVMGLNPHAGENGAFGNEEAREIGPAVRKAQREGIEAVGPLPPDTVFMRALRGHFDAVVCMYHDQGHIPMKTIGLDDTVNVTIGLPVVRTSVDHGTAFDIAYKGVVSTGSFENACRLAALLAG